MVNRASKGYRREKQIVDLLKAFEYNVQRTHRTRWLNNDFFGMYDIIAIQKEHKLVFAQVKSNRVTKQERECQLDFYNDWINKDGVEVVIFVVRDRIGVDAYFLPDFKKYMITWIQYKEICEEGV